MLPWKCHSGHIMELCDESNNCTKFQLYTVKVVRDNKLVILHHNKINAIFHHFERSFK